MVKAVSLGRVRNVRVSSVRPASRVMVAGGRGRRGDQVALVLYLSGGGSRLVLGVSGFVIEQFLFLSVFF